MGRQLRKLNLIVCAFELSLLDDDVLALDVAERGKSLSQRLHARSLRRSGGQTQIPDPIDLVCPLRPRRERPESARRRAAGERNELAPPHVGPPPPELVYCTFSLPQGGKRVL